MPQLARQARRAQLPGCVLRIAPAQRTMQRRLGKGGPLCVTRITHALNVGATDMAVRTMMFIDGTWLAVTANRMADQLGYAKRVGGPLRFGALPLLCAEHVARQLPSGDPLDVVRTHYFASIATNYDPVDDDAVQRRSEFFDALRRQHRYEVYRYDIDYRGGRVRRAQRPDEQTYEPREKAVDVGLATALLEMTALSAFDIAIVVGGDRDFVPALQAVRRLGKRVAIVSARGSCPREFYDPNDPLRLRDFDPIWLDDLWPKLVNTPELTSSHFAQPEPSLPQEHTDGAPPTEPADVEVPQLVVALADDHVSSAVADTPVHDDDAGSVHALVTKVHPTGYAFARDDEGLDYYFRREDLNSGNTFDDLTTWKTRVHLTLSASARPGNAGRARAVSITQQLTNAVQPPAPAAPWRTATQRRAGTTAALPALTTDAWDADPFAAPVRRTI